MDRRAFIAAMAAAPIVPIAVKLAPARDGTVTELAVSLDVQMERVWRECIRDAKKPEWIVFREGTSSAEEPFWGRT